MPWVYVTCLAKLWHTCILKELKKTKNDSGYLRTCHRANFQSNWSSSCQETVWNTCRICEIMLRVNSILTLLCSSVYYPCYVSSIVSTWTCSVCILSYLVAHLVTHPVKIWVRQSDLNWKIKLWGSLKWHFVVNSAFCLGFAYRAVTIWQVGILHVACIAIQMWLLLNQ